MIDELQRIGHRLLRSSERLRESLAKILDAALQQDFVIDPSIFSQRPFDGIWTFPGDLESFVERAQKIDGELAVLRILQPRLSRRNHGGGKEPIIAIHGPKEQGEAGGLRSQAKRISDHRRVDPAAEQGGERLADAAVLDENNFS